ncbi:hypothetical protein A2678_00730 [Candidatus Kaiserbacteria bacterium RIFCSPHIGHO2_01_FULL_53_31]|uniref:D-alanine--D-alanine ligase n=1 Tax=Candidatus Kaiserbacteria bacterium RIFCSPHIGHO2_01_FULL_53_31 TaxID=1798481 RepID=A0A1F6CGX1_9BACT|nr:MAG: hypothetical protein A2678_00730 [Candidatus Kaiserbacteria bacterium RIFCSPHIGHO2_01_FULL_53_31]
MQTIVGVLRGGASREHEVSLETGAAMLKHLPKDRFETHDIYIDKSGAWHDRGRPTSPDRVLRQLDAVLIGLHGEYGEDGEVQKLLERFGVPFAGAGSLGSYLAMHKILAKARAREAGLLTPDFHYIEHEAEAETVAREIIRTFNQPVIVKPVGWGSSIGISLAAGYAKVVEAVKNLFKQGAPSVLVEEFIRGREATAGVVENLRGEKFYSLPPVEIIPPPEAGYFAAQVKYNGETKEICPGNFSRVETEELKRAAKVMHRALGLRHYSRSDFIVSPRGVYYLETNTLPGLNAESLYPKSLAAVGVQLPEFLSHLVNLALAK